VWWTGGLRLQLARRRIGNLEEREIELHDNRW
jgi:hypothetical protein